MAQNYILVWSVISPKVCCKIGSIVFLSLAVPELKRIGKLRPSLGKSPGRMELLLAASAAHHMHFCIILLSAFPILSCASVLRWSSCSKKATQKLRHYGNVLLAQLTVIGGWHIDGQLFFTWSSGDSGRTMFPSPLWGSEGHPRPGLSSSQPEGIGT